MCKKRIVGPGKTRGYPYPVCKKWMSQGTDQIYHTLLLPYCSNTHNDVPKVAQRTVSLVVHTENEIRPLYCLAVLPCDTSRFFGDVVEFPPPN